MGIGAPSICTRIYLFIYLSVWSLTHGHGAASPRCLQFIYLFMWLIISSSSWSWRRGRATHSLINLFICSVCSITYLFAAGHGTASPNCKFIHLFDHAAIRCSLACPLVREWGTTLFIYLFAHSRALPFTGLPARARHHLFYLFPSSVRASIQTSAASRVCWAEQIHFLFFQLHTFTHLFLTFPTDFQNA